ncbi:UNVERIFIED_CONTAM: hypothetical protein H355_014452 [Colinus virginianus]|nr:hypothetical protein H355_014452 [Colinus virginianus]
MAERTECTGREEERRKSGSDGSETERTESGARAESAGRREGDQRGDGACGQMVEERGDPRDGTPVGRGERVHESGPTGREWGRWSVVVMDTPAIFGGSSWDKKKLADERKRCLDFAAHKPCVLLLVTQLGRYTREDRKVQKGVQKLFRDATEHMMVVFTRKEDLEDDSLDTYVRTADNGALKKLVDAYYSNGMYLDSFLTEEKVRRHMESASNPWAALLNSVPYRTFLLRYGIALICIAVIFICFLIGWNR